MRVRPGTSSGWDLRNRRIPALTVAVAFIAFGVTLLLQPERWFNTPSYANLLLVIDVSTWGWLYLLGAALLCASAYFRKTRWVLVLAHTYGLALAVFWDAAFVVRYATDSGTTIVNIVSWGILITRLIQSAVVLDDDYEYPPVLTFEREDESL